MLQDSLVNMAYLKLLQFKNRTLDSKLIVFNSVNVLTVTLSLLKEMFHNETFIFHSGYHFGC
jgi:hypothetical protein